MVMGFLSACISSVNKLLILFSKSQFQILSHIFLWWLLCSIFYNIPYVPIYSMLFAQLHLTWYIVLTLKLNLLYLGSRHGTSHRNHSFVWYTGASARSKSKILIHNTHLHLLFHNNISSLIRVSTWHLFTFASNDSYVHLLIHSCICWHTIKILVQLIAHSCIWWLTVASAYSTVTSGGLQLHLLMQRYIW